MPPDRPGDHRRATARFGGLHPGDGRHFDHQKLRRTPTTRPDRVLADKAYSTRKIRDALRRRGIKVTIPEPSNQVAGRKSRGANGGRPPKFDKEIYKTRNTVERAINRLRGYRAVATRYDKREFVYKGTIDVASIGIWLR